VYLYHILFVTINIRGIGCKKKEKSILIMYKFVESFVSSTY
jgi:hypothetical protein